VIRQTVHFLSFIISYDRQTLKFITVTLSLFVMEPNAYAVLHLQEVEKVVSEKDPVNVKVHGKTCVLYAFLSCTFYLQNHELQSCNLHNKLCILIIHHVSKTLCQLIFCSLSVKY